MTGITGGRNGIVIHQIKLPDTSEGENIVLLKKFILFAGKEKKVKDLSPHPKLKKRLMSTSWTAN